LYPPDVLRTGICSHTPHWLDECWKIELTLRRNIEVVVKNLALTVFAEISLVLRCPLGKTRILDNGELDWADLTLVFRRVLGLDEGTPITMDLFHLVS